ncbi:MAG TPA: YfhO family protein [Candidatus Sulfotelmatobacter sp.]|nr:YfhO family protein [Candidatus Sulfotelmatobacter sp.]
MSETRLSEPQTSSPRSASGAESPERGGFYLWVIALAGVLAVLLHASLFEGRGLVSSDGIFNFPPWLESKSQPSDSLLADQYLVFIPQHEFTYREFMRGDFPLWNPNLDCGIPNLASIAGALLYPINLLLLPVAPFYAAGLAAFLKLFLAGLFTMLYVRLLGASNAGAFLSGVVFSLSGFMVCWLGHPHVNCALCLPALLYFIERTFQFGRNHVESLASKTSLRVWACLGITFGCLLLGGHPPTMIHVAGFAGIYFLFRLTGQWDDQALARIGLAVAAVVIGCFLAAPAILPFLEYYRYGSTDASSMALNRAAIKLPLNTLILWLCPKLNGTALEGHEDIMLWLGIGNLLPNFVERSGYVGILPWMLALCGVIFNRNRLTVFFGLSIVVSLLAVYGMPPFPALFESAPIIKDANPTRLLLIAGFGVAVLAGLGWDGFYRLENSRKRLWAMAGFWLFMAVVALCFWDKIEPRWKYLDAASRAYVEPQFLMMAGNVVVAGALLLPSIGGQRVMRSIIGVGWVTLDLLSFGMGINPTISHDDYYPGAPSIGWLQQDKTNFRILGLGTALVPDTSELYGIKDARGYDFISIKRYEQLIDGTPGLLFFYRAAAALPNALPMLGVKYVLNFNSAPPAPPQFDLVYSNTVTIYRNRQFQGRAMTVFDYSVDKPASILVTIRSGSFNPRQSLLLEQEPTVSGPRLSGPEASKALAESTTRIASEKPDELTVEASMPQPGFLLLLDTWYPGWKATVNGLSSPILRADYNFRAVRLPAGKSVVQFSYQPESFRLGMGLFLAGLAIIGGLVFGRFEPFLSR